MTNLHRVAAVSAALFMLAGAAVADSIAPADFSATLKVGESVTIKKKVTIDAGSPTTAKVDVFFLADTTGSMGGQINAAKANAGTIISSLSSLGNVQFGVGEYKDTFDSFTYRTNTGLTGNAADVTAGIGLWSAGGGGDFPEGNLIGLQRVAQETAWRDGSTRVIVQFGDAPGHVGRTDSKADASGDFLVSDEANTLAALEDKGITVQIGNPDGTGPGGMNAADGGAAANQANRIAAATGGSVFTLSSSGEDIAALIKEAVEATFATYSKVELLPVGNLPGVEVTTTGPITGDFDRETTNTFDFEVTFKALTEGTHKFSIDALVDGGFVASEADTITVNGDGPGPGPAPIPLPAGLPLLIGALGLGGLIVRRRKP